MKKVKKSTVKKSSVKKAQLGTKLKTSAARDNTRVDNSSARISAEVRKQKEKDAKDYKKISGKYSAIAMPDRDSAIPGDSIRYFPGQRGNIGVPYTRDMGVKGLAQVSNKQLLEASKNKRTRTYQDTLRIQANKDIMNNLKKGGVVKKIVKSIKKKK
jgi:hypothetical protein